MQEITVEELIAERNELRQQLVIAQEESETWRRALIKMGRERDELRRRLIALMHGHQALANCLAEWAKLDKARGA